MDALDLSTGERISGLKSLTKGSRRKASAPQRRQFLAVSNDAGQGENRDTFPENVNDSHCLSNFTDVRNVQSSLRCTESPKDILPSRRLSADASTEDIRHHALTDGSNRYKCSSNDLNGRLGPERDQVDSEDFEFSHSPQCSYNTNNNSNEISEPLSDDGKDGLKSPSTAFQVSASDNYALSLLPQLSTSVGDLMQQRLRRYLDDVQPAEAPGIPERTKKQNRWAFNVWREWARKRNMLEDSFSGPFKGVPLDVGQANEVELDYWLCKFVMEIRRKDGNPYPSHTLMQIVMGIQRYLRQQAGKPSICILDRSNQTYCNFRTVLDQRIKELTNNGATAMQKAINRVTLLGKIDEKEFKSSIKHLTATGSSRNCSISKHTALWKRGLMGTQSAQALLNAVFHHNHKTFDIQYIDDHWNLRAENFAFHIDEDGSKSLEFTPSATSMMAATAHANGVTIIPKKIWEDSSEQSVYSYYEKYLSLIPSFGPFYRHPVEPTIVDRSIKFSEQWVGKNRLRTMLKQLTESGNGVNEKTEHGQQSITKFPSLQIRLPSQATLHEKLGIIKPLSAVKPHDSSEDTRDSIFTPPSPKRLKTEDESFTASTNVRQRSEALDAKCVTYEGDIAGPTQARGVKDSLEIAVPPSIKAVTVIRGSRKITIQLD